jgi:hypothetical protein
MYCDGRFKVLVVSIAMAELFSCHLLSTLAAAGDKANYTLLYII